MKKKKDKIILNISYESDAAESIKEHIDNGNAADFRYKILDRETILFIPSEDKSYKLALKFNNKKDENCMMFLDHLEDLSRLQLEYSLTASTIQISFFITRLTEEEIDKALFEDGISVNDVDPQIMVGLILNNRFHG